MLGNETEVPAARLHTAGFGFEFVAGEMEVYLLAAEFEGMTG